MEIFECIFCGKKINSDNEKVSSILVTTNWDTENEQSQQFFCHFDCFKEKCQNKNAIYIDEE